MQKKYLDEAGGASREKINLDVVLFELFESSRHNVSDGNINEEDYRVVPVGEN